MTNMRTSAARDKPRLAAARSISSRVFSSNRIITGSLRLRLGGSGTAFSSGLLEFALLRTRRQHPSSSPVLVPDHRLGKPGPGLHDGHGLVFGCMLTGRGHVTQALSTISPRRGWRVIRTLRSG
jgi:hypothetical protein